MEYFYTPRDHITGTDLSIDGEEFAHLTHVMRKREGDEIRVVDGEGAAYDVRIEALRNKTARCGVLAVHPRHHEPGQRVTLGVGILKNPSKFDFLVEKVTELGVDEIVPLLTERTIPSHARADRWQKLALAAMKQAGRSWLPRVRELTTLSSVLAEGKEDWLKRVAHERAMPEAGDEKILAGDRGHVIILVGPEGGFSEEEVQRCLAAAYSPLYLGERRLRTETAAIVAVAGILIAHRI